MSDTAKPAKPKPYQHRLTPTDCLVLDRLSGVLKEQARLSSLPKSYFMLAQMRTTIESIADREPRQLPPLEQAAVLFQIITVPPDHYLSAEQVQEIREREFNAAFGAVCASDDSALN